LARLPQTSTRISIADHRRGLHPGGGVSCSAAAASLLADIEERFRRLLLQRLNRAERLSEAFLNNLLGWNPSGFSVYANQLVFDDEPDRLERLARYLTRAPIAVDAVRTDDDARVEVTTPISPSQETPFYNSTLSIGFMPSANRLSRGE